MLTVYAVITNEGDQNRVIAASINADGTLVSLISEKVHGRDLLLPSPDRFGINQNLDRAVSTGGSGAHGITDPNGPDALFSQVCCRPRRYHLVSMTEPLSSGLHQGVGQGSSAGDGQRGYPAVDRRRV